MAIVIDLMIVEEKMLGSIAKSVHWPSYDGFWLPIPSHNISSSDIKRVNEWQQMTTHFGSRGPIAAEPCQDRLSFFFLVCMRWRIILYWLGGGEESNCQGDIKRILFYVAPNNQVFAFFFSLCTWSHTHTNKHRWPPHSTLLDSRYARAYRWWYNLYTEIPKSSEPKASKKGFKPSRGPEHGMCKITIYSEKFGGLDMAFC